MSCCCGAHLLLLSLSLLVAKKIPIKGVTTFQPCPSDKPLLAAFIAESKGQPAVATVLDHSGEQPVTISRKSFYRATGNPPQTEGRGEKDGGRERLRGLG